MIPVIGYSDKLTVQPNEQIAFKVSSTSQRPYRARLVRLISGDPNPQSPGVQEIDVPADFAGDYPSRFQDVRLGSYVRVNADGILNGVKSFTASATIWPTTPKKPDQGVIARTNGTAGFALVIGPDGAEARLGASRVAVGKPLRERRWARVWCAFDAETGRLSVGQEQLSPEQGIDDAGTAETIVQGRKIDADRPLLIAALEETGGRTCFNGKIERPIVTVPRHEFLLCYNE